MKKPLFLPALLIAALGISVGSARAGDTVVGIEATEPVTSEPAPHIRVIPGKFVISRRGDTEDELPVWIDYTGTADSGTDYHPLPNQFIFAPGESRIELLVQGIDDEEVERPETVIARVYDATLGPLPLFEVDPDHESATVTIHDSDRPSDAPVVSIEATRPIAEETAAPLRRVNLVGEFTVSRSGSALNPLPVWIHLSGSATPGDDYQRLPLSVRIPAGEKSVTIPVTANFDQEPEGIETVVATISNCPPDGILAPCYAFTIDETKERATVFIREDGLSVASLHITAPASGDHFPSGQPIPIRATAIHLEGYISRVEFWADETRIGESEIVFVRAPDPGTPIHHQIVWERAPAGLHVLTARAGILIPDGFPGREALVSNPVRITVGKDGENEEPRAIIASPAPGEQFPAGDPIEIAVEGLDPDGYIQQVELFADGLKIGEMNISFLVEPPPGQPQAFTFSWERPMPGDYALTARVTDNGGRSSDSAPVPITVNPRDARPVVTVVATDALAVEPGSAEATDSATFRIRRSGPIRGELVVLYTLGGRAENGVDYERRSGRAVIPNESSSVDVTVVPLPDREPERPESVIFQLVKDPAYLLQNPRRAFAVIRDNPWPRPSPPQFIPLADGLIHLCFPAPGGMCFRLEGSRDLQNWATLYCLVPIDGAIHFVDEASPRIPRRFFRIAPEPEGLAGE